MPNPTPDILQQSLKQIRLFSALPEDLLDRLTLLTSIRTVRKGESIFLQNEPSPYCFGILFGRVRIQRVPKNRQGPTKRLGDLGPGEFFGESALFSDTARSATATADTDGQLVTLLGTKLRAWIGEQPEHGVPIMLGLLQSSLERLQETSTELSIIHGVERLLNNTRPFGESLPETLRFLENALPGIEQLVVYERSESWEEFIPCAAAQDAPEKALPFQHPFSQRLTQSEAPSTLTAAELDAWKVRGVILDADVQAVAAVPIWNRDNAESVLEGFFLAASRMLGTLSPNQLLLLATVGQMIGEALLRHKRIEDSQARQRHTRNTFPK